LQGAVSAGDHLCGWGVACAPGGVVADRHSDDVLAAGAVLQQRKSARLLLHPVREHLRAGGPPVPDPPEVPAAVYAAVAYLTLLSQSRSALLALGALTILSLLGRPVRLLLFLGGCCVLYLLLTM